MDSENGLNIKPRYVLASAQIVSVALPVSY